MIETSKKTVPVPQAEIKKMRSMRWEGHSTADIMRATGRSSSVVRHWAPLPKDKQKPGARRYSAAEKKALIREMTRMYYDDDLDYRQISALTGVSRKTISEWLQVKGNAETNAERYKAAAARGYAEGKSAGEIAEELGVHPNTVYKYAPTSPYWWTSKEIQIALEMSAQGRTQQMIANRLGRPRTAVNKKLAHYKKGLAQ